MWVAGIRRKAIALAGLAVVAGLAWTTIGAGKIRLVTMIVLGAFALRIVLTQGHSRYDEEKPPE